MSEAKDIHFTLKIQSMEDKDESFCFRETFYNVQMDNELYAKFSGTIPLNIDTFLELRSKIKESQSTNIEDIIKYLERVILFLERRLTLSQLIEKITGQNINTQFENSSSEYIIHYCIENAYKFKLSQFEIEIESVL